MRNMGSRGGAGTDSRPPTRSEPSKPTAMKPEPSGPTTKSGTDSRPPMRSEPSKPTAMKPEPSGPTAKSEPPPQWAAPAPTDTKDNPATDSKNMARQDSKFSARMTIKENVGLCFPCEPFGFCPGAVRGFMPSTLQRIQDATHCMLVVGVIASLTMLFLDAVDLFSFGECVLPQNFFCAKEILILFFGIPFFGYCCTTVGQFDKDLQERQKAIKQQMNMLLMGLKDLVVDMEGLLASTTESATGLAEKNFENHRKDFRRFLDRARNRFGEIALTDPEVVTEFKKFVLHWLNVFKECSIDPVGHPKVLLDPEELDRCISVQEICDLCLERITVTEVKFISAQRDDFTTKLNQRRGSMQKKTWGKRAAAIMDGAEDTLMANQAEQAKDMPMEVADDDLPDSVTWVQCGGGKGCNCCGSAKGAPESGFPRDCSCICFRFVVLSNSHRMLMFTFVLGIVLLVAEVGLIVRGLATPEEQVDNGNPILLLLVAAVQLSLITVLMKFESIDVVQQLEREVEVLQTENQDVQAEREAMTEFWSKANDLAEFWLYRTEARLGLGKEVHQELLSLVDDQPQDVVKILKKINPALGNIEKSLGDIEDWKGKGAMTVNQKKQFSEAIGKVTNMYGHDLNAICNELQSFRPALVNK